VSYVVKDHYGTQQGDSYGTRDFAVMTAQRLARRNGKPFHVYTVGDRYGPSHYVVTAHETGKLEWADGIKVEYA
jgi:hypothetical protein